LININPTLLIQLVNFLLLMYLLNRLLFRPMLRVLQERKDRTEGRRERAAQADAEAESVLALYQKRLQEARTAADRIRTSLVREGEAERQKLVESAASEADKNLAQIRARVRAEAEEARATLRDEARRLAGAAAERILGRAV
jgi:F-type H+-transporting ATPase subunit b